MVQMIFAELRRLQTFLAVAGKGRFLCFGAGLHVGRGSRLWAPKELRIGHCVYIGKQVHIEANADIGDYCLIANRVAFVGRHDHDFRRLGFPVRFAPWIGSRRFPSPYLNEKVVLEQDVWIGYGSIVLTGVTVGKGSVVAAGSLVTRDIPPYSIAAGSPARVIGPRFADPADIARHEEMIQSGRFEFSERSYDDCVIEPGSSNIRGGA